MLEQLNKTKMCKFHPRGLCTKGSQCPFAHDVRELQPLPDLSCSKLCMTLRKTGRCDNPRCSYAHQEAELQTSSTFYKTKICRYWRAGKCPLGLACSFAHSEGEIRPSCSGDEVESTSESYNDYMEERSPSSVTDVSEEYTNQRDGKFVQEAADEAKEAMQRKRNQHHSWKQSRDKSIDEPVFASHYDLDNLVDGVNAHSEPARIKLDSLKTSFSIDSEPTLDPALSAKAWEDWSREEIAACPEFVPFGHAPPMPTAPSWPFKFPPGLMPVDNPWVLPSDISAMSKNFGGKTVTVEDSYFSGEFGAAVDEVSAFSQIKNDGLLTVAEFYQVTNKCCVIEPEKVSLPCLRT